MQCPPQDLKLILSLPVEVQEQLESLAENSGMSLDEYITTVLKEKALDLLEERSLC